MFPWSTARFLKRVITIQCKYLFYSQFWFLSFLPRRKGPITGILNSHLLNEVDYISGFAWVRANMRCLLQPPVGEHVLPRARRRWCGWYCKSNVAADHGTTLQYAVESPRSPLGPLCHIAHTLTSFNQLISLGFSPSDICVCV